ncbi:hypothetical protein Cantr_04721 [Candida viswanathii]|uniref:Zn(2)-C6 fungal-type domain-containing protein n=1 Tax=Candida viswanathii TaxID=5486 RepID=A0A367XPW6_9ASCO|nr:hypothetical protein Cantr_04721 [Candida viswanathii]
MVQFVITTNQPTKRKKTSIACSNCRKLHRKCITIRNTTQCEPCATRNQDCKWTTERPKQPSRFERFKEEEQIYSTVISNSTNSKSQFVCSTHPIASFLSTDKFLCFDGDKFGLFNPWKNSPTIEPGSEDGYSSELREFLKSQGALVLPPVAEQRELMRMFMEKVYPFYPVIENDDIRYMPSLLLNAIFLAATRCLPGDVRERCQALFERCKLLELAENNKIVLLQSYLLMSIHEEGINGSSLSREYIVKACNLCGDVGLTTLSGSNGTVQDTQHRVYDKAYYGQSLLNRLFWVSYCCDRLSAAIHSRETFFDMKDVFIDDVSDEFQQLKNFVSLAKLIERTLYSHYRPPAGRSIDATLGEDLQNWAPEQGDVHPWLGLLHSYVCMLYLRCKIDPVAWDQKVYGSIHKHAKNTLAVDGVWFLVFVVGVHSLLHVLSSLTLFDRDSTHDEEKVLKTNVVDLLKRLEGKWWLAAAGLKMFVDSTEGP